MRDVEELLRETLTDPRRRIEPGPGMYETVRELARARRHRQSAVAAACAAVVALALAGSLFGVQHSDRHRGTPVATPLPSPSASGPVHGGLGGTVSVGSGWAVAAVATPDALYAVTSSPNQVVRLDANGTGVQATASGPGGTPSGITVGGGRVFAWSQDSGEVRAYDETTLAQLGSANTGLQLFNGAAVDGNLWLTSNEGLHEWTPAHDGRPAVLTRVTVIGGFVYGLAADVATHRILVGVTSPDASATNGFTGARVVAIDARTGKVLAQSPQTNVGKESIAVVGDQVWVGGYGDTDKPRIEHLDANTLQVVGTSPVSDQLGPGAILWPGASVLWVRNGGNEQLSCIDPKTGEILEVWAEVQGPITSVEGHAFGIQSGLQRLALFHTCPG
jgi:hypothetical protein